jgi:hypothetical protein
LEAERRQVSKCRTNLLASMGEISIHSLCTVTQYKIPKSAGLGILCHQVALRLQGSSIDPLPQLHSCDQIFGYLWNPKGSCWSCECWQSSGNHLAIHSKLVKSLRSFSWHGQNRIHSTRLVSCNSLAMQTRTFLHPPSPMVPMMVPSRPCGLARRTVVLGSN